MFNFEKLETWHEAVAFADLTYQLTRQFPTEERLGLTDQIRGAAVSISSNIAKGSSRSSKADYIRFLEIATSSLFEVVSQTTIARNQGWLTEADYHNLYQAAEKQSRLLSGLRKSLEGKRPLALPSHVLSPVELDALKTAIRDGIATVMQRAQEEIFTKEQAAEFLKVSISTIEKQVALGKLKRSGNTRRWVFRREDLLSYSALTPSTPRKRRSKSKED